MRRAAASAALGLLLALLAVPARGQTAAEAPSLLAAVTGDPTPAGVEPGPTDPLGAPLRPGVRAAAAAHPTPYEPVLLADRQTIYQFAIGGALLGCAIGVFMGPEQGSAFACGVGLLTGGLTGALIGSGM